MKIELIVENFLKQIRPGNIIAIGTSKYDTELIDELVQTIILKKISVSFIASTNKQARHLHDLGQKTISLSEKEIDLAIEFVDQVDQYNNFVKKDTKSYIRDKMIAQSALKLIVVCDKRDLIENIDKDVYVEISNFAWQRTLLNLQSYGNARMVVDEEQSFVKTEIGHYIARITLDSNISLEDFEYSVRNIPGVLETGVFLGVLDTIFVVDYNNPDFLEIKRRI
jgi:ribose 5-phosphate isomerase A